MAEKEVPKIHYALFQSIAVKPTDYKDYGGNIERWADDDKDYKDCSCGCRHYATLLGPLGSDWGVCLRIDGPRFGLLTFEHQAGFDCFEYDETLDQD